MAFATTEVSIGNTWADLSLGGTVGTLIIQAATGKPMEIVVGTSSMPAADARGHGLARWDGNVFRLDGLTGEYVWARSAGAETAVVVTRG